MKVITTEYGNTREILMYAHDQFTGRAVMVSSTGITADADTGKIIVPAGTIVSGVEAMTPVVADNTATAEGVLLHDVDVTHGDAMGTVIIRGVINLTKIPEAPTTEANESLGLKGVIFATGGEV